MKPFIINAYGLLLLNLLFSTSIKAQSDSKTIPYGNNKEAGHSISVEGVNIYYEIYG